MPRASNSVQIRFIRGIGSKPTSNWFRAETEDACHSCINDGSPELLRVIRQTEDSAAKERNLQDRNQLSRVIADKI